MRLLRPPTVQSLISILRPHARLIIIFRPHALRIVILWRGTRLLTAVGTRLRPDLNGGAFGVIIGSCLRSRSWHLLWRVHLSLHAVIHARRRVEQHPSAQSRLHPAAQLRLHHTVQLLPQLQPRPHAAAPLQLHPAVGRVSFINCETHMASPALAAIIAMWHMIICGLLKKT